MLIADAPGPIRACDTPTDPRHPPVAAPKDDRREDMATAR